MKLTFDFNMDKYEDKNLELNSSENVEGVAAKMSLEFEASELCDATKAMSDIIKLAISEAKNCGGKRAMKSCCDCHDKEVSTDSTASKAIVDSYKLMAEKLTWGMFVSVLNDLKSDLLGGRISIEDADNVLETAKKRLVNEDRDENLMAEQMRSYKRAVIDCQQ